MNYYPHSNADLHGAKTIKVLPTVYVLATQDLRLVKVGRTISIRQRIINIQSGCPFDLFLWLAIKTPLASQVEKELHHQLRHCQTRGEWFAPNDSDLDFLISFFKETNRSVREAASALLQA